MDTPSNRTFVPESEWKNFQHPAAISEIVYMWLNGVNSPANGAFVGFEKQNDGSLTFKSY